MITIGLIQHESLVSTSSTYTYIFISNEMKWHTHFKTHTHTHTLNISKSTQTYIHNNQNNLVNVTTSSSWIILLFFWFKKKIFSIVWCQPDCLIFDSVGYWVSCCFFCFLNVVRWQSLNHIIHTHTHIVNDFIFNENFWLKNFRSIYVFFSLFVCCFVRSTLMSLHCTEIFFSFGYSIEFFYCKCECWI